MIAILENLKTFFNEDVYDEVYQATGNPNGVNGIILDTRIVELSNYPDLKVISRNGVGLDNIDLEECKRRNIIVKITDCSELSYAVAEHALYLVLRLLKNRGEMIRDKQIGIIGFGRIGFTFNKIVKGMVWDYPICYDKIDGNLIFKERLLKDSDIVVVCVSGNDEVIGQQEIDMMKQGSYIVNVARDKCVDDQAIALSIIEKHKFFGYASDVRIHGEIIHNLFEEDHNIIYTPHNASLPAKAVMERQCVDNLIEGLKEWKK